MKGRLVFLILFLAVCIRVAEARVPLAAYGGVFYRLAQHRQEHGDLAGAEAFYKKALRCRPDMTTAYEALGDIYMLRGDRARAIEQFQAAVDADPQLYRAYTALGWLHLAEGHSRQAVAAFKRANGLRNCCNPSIYRYDLGLAYLLEGDAKKACSLTEDVQEFGDPDLAGDLSWLGDCRDPVGP